jgi:hypothetical protein
VDVEGIAGLLLRIGDVGDVEIALVGDARGGGGGPSEP